MIGKKLSLILSACLVLATACANNDNPIIAPSAIGNEAPSTENALTIDPASASVEVGKTLQLATVFNQNGEAQRGLPTNWVSLNPDIAIVDANGVVTGLKEGSTRIRAESLGQTALVSLTVGAPAAVPGVPTASADPGIGIVDEDSELSEELAKLRSIVIKPENEAVQPTIFKFSRLTEQRQFVAVGKDSEGQDIKNITFTWSSSDEGIATVNSTGVVTAVATGVTNLIAEAGGVTSNIIQVEVQEGTIRAHIKFTE